MSKYEAFFGRAADFVREPQPKDSPLVSVFRFPPRAAGFFRRIFTPLHDKYVYITHGMSNIEMNIPEKEKHIYPTRIELITCCAGVYVGEIDGSDMVSATLQLLALQPFDSGIFFGPMHTASLEGELCPGSKMSSFLFALPEGVDMPRLCSCTPRAKLVVSVMPIAESERSYMVEHGPAGLIGLFERHQVRNVFDPFREPVL